MSVMDSLRKGLRFFLMSFGVSSSNGKPKPAANPKSSTRPVK